MKKKLLIKILILFIALSGCTKQEQPKTFDTPPQKETTKTQIFDTKPQNLKPPSREYISDTKYSAVNRAYFYEQPYAGTKTSKYLVKGDRFFYTEKENGFVYGEFTNNKTKKTTKGWISLDDLTGVKPKVSNEQDIPDKTTFEKTTKTQENKVQNEKKRNFQCDEFSAEDFATQYVNNLYPDAGRPSYNWGKLSDCTYGFNFAPIYRAGSYLTLTVIVELGENGWRIKSREFN